MSPKEPPRTENTTLEQGSDERHALEAEWDRRLACLNDPDARKRIDAVMDASGRMKKRPIAGTY